MYSISQLRKYISVLLLQDVLLLATAAFGAYVFWIKGANAPLTYGWFQASVFVATLLISTLLLSVWNVLIDLTEGLWSIRAQSRIRKWLMLSLKGAMLFSLIGLALVWGQHVFGADASILVKLTVPIASFTLVFAAFVPLGASALLTAGSIKHFIGARKANAEMIYSITGKDSSLSRIGISVLSDRGDSATSVRPNPKGFFVAGLTSKPWYESDAFAWSKNFENSFDDILKEAKTVLGASLEHLDHYHYPGIDTGRWRIFSFVADRKENTENMKKCPATAQALRSIPGFPFFRDAMFSILEPGGVIKPHRDHSNLFLTMHFGLMTPDKGYMEVAGMKQPWHAGRTMFFDSSYYHQAVNESDEARVVLLVDFLHPELTEAERRWVENSPLWRQ